VRGGGGEGGGGVRTPPGVGQRRSATTPGSAHADSPPPRLDSAILRKAKASAGGVTRRSPRGAGGAAGGGAGSLMDEVRVVRQLVGVGGGRQRIGRLPAVRAIPVALEHVDEPGDQRPLGGPGARAAPPGEGAPRAVHR